MATLKMKYDSAAFLSFLRNKARELDLSVGMSGGYGDGGSSRLVATIEAYEAGQQGVLPEQWKEYAKEYEKITDPEYETYVRLKQKFER